MIQAGDQVHIKPEHQDEGDDKYVWRAVEHEDGGRVRIQPDLGLPINPTQVVKTDMLASSGRGYYEETGDHDEECPLCHCETCQCEPEWHRNDWKFQ